MVIHSPEFLRENGQVRLQARIEIDSRYQPFPSHCWFEFPDEFETLLYQGLEPFLTTLMPLAMGIGENIEVRGPLSSKLVYHLYRYQEMFNFWLPEQFHRVEIRGEGYLSHKTRGRAAGAATTFSGGVDSFFSLYSNLSEHQPIPGYALTHGVFLFQFDLGDRYKDTYLTVLKKYQEIFTGLGLTLIPASSNMRQFFLGRTFRSRFNWFYHTFGSILAGVGQALSGGIGRFYIPSGMPFDYEGSNGSQMRTDQCLSTEWFEVIHQGIAEKRVEKIRTLVYWPPIYGNLRVCFTSPNELQNCCRCAKCLRTMVSLACLGELDKHTNFSEPLGIRKVLKYLSMDLEPAYFRENLSLAIERGAFRIALLVILAYGLRFARRGFNRAVEIISIIKPSKTQLVSGLNIRPGDKSTDP